MAEKRRLVVCTDGTWNSPDDEDRGKRKPTNITKISRAVLPVAGDGTTQIVYYDEGVGTSWGQKMVGGITGFGLSDNIKGAYQFLSYNYAEGDEIYLFGFSRGAYTSCSLCGFIDRVGILTKDDVFYLPEMFEFYRNRAGTDEIDAFLAEKDLNRYSPRVRMIGVFDTVGALGIPVGGINKLISGFKIAEFQFHDVTLSSNVDYAYHALGIDERRVPFEPSLWQRQPDECKEMEQRWFAGVHSNIGGGYHPDGLANLALQYVIGKAAGLGLEFDQSYVSAYQGFPDSELRDSMSLKYRVLGEYVRPITLGDASNQVVDESVRERVGNDDSYRPPNLPA